MVFSISHKELQETIGTVNTALVNPNQKDPHGTEFQVLDAIFSFICLFEQCKTSLELVWSRVTKKGKRHSKIS